MPVCCWRSCVAMAVKRARRALGGRSGLTTMELLIAASILGLLITGLMRIQLGAVKVSQATENRIFLVREGERVLERLSTEIRGAFKVVPGLSDGSRVVFIVDSPTSVQAVGYVYSSTAGQIYRVEGDVETLTTIQGTTLLREDVKARKFVIEYFAKGNLDVQVQPASADTVRITFEVERRGATATLRTMVRLRNAG